MVKLDSPFLAQSHLQELTDITKMMLDASFEHKDWGRSLKAKLATCIIQQGELLRASLTQSLSSPQLEWRQQRNLNGTTLCIHLGLASWTCLQYVSERRLALEPHNQFMDVGIRGM